MVLERESLELGNAWLITHMSVGADGVGVVHAGFRVLGVFDSHQLLATTTYGNQNAASRCCVCLYGHALI